MLITAPTPQEESADSVKDAISLTLWHKQIGIITKKISRDADGNLVKDGSQCRMPWGIGERVDLPFSGLPNLLKKLSPHNAVSLGVPKNQNLPDKFNVMSAKKINGTADTITRSLKHMGWAQSDNIMVVIDYDPAKDADRWAPSELVATIAEILPGFEDVARVVTHSTSSCISDEHGEEITGPSAGYHIYFMMPSGTDVKRFVEIFKVRAWIAGYGHVMLSKSGSKLVRNRLFDEFVFSPERLIFETGAVIPEGWTQNRPEPIYTPGKVFDPATLPDLSNEEMKRYDTLVDKAKRAIAGAADETRKKYVDVKAKDLHARKPDVSLAICRTTIEKACTNGDLYGDFEIHLDSGEVVTVAGILRNPGKYDRATCHDPLEPGNTTAGKAQIFINKGKGNEKPVIKSFWHGDHILFLHAKVAFDAEQVVDGILQWIDATDDPRAILDGWTSKLKGLNSNDEDIILNAVLEKTNVKIGTLNRDLKKQKARDKKAKAKARAEKVSAERAKNGIKEILYHSTQTGECCHEVSKALREHPEGKIYRFAGNLVKIANKQPTTVRMVQKIHDQGGKYPAMPTIAQFSKETLCHEIEKVAVCRTKDDQGNEFDIPWPKNILAGVMALTECHEKPLVGIVEHPFVNDGGEPVLTQGYDDRTGLYKVFDVAPDIEFFNNASTALLYLIDEVLKDFPFATKLDEMAAVAGLLTGMQRKLINDNSGCPGFVFTAPVQSSGKTTLCQTISHSLYGRPAAASSFSDDDTEMAKHLLGILQEGHSSILFDNLPEGSVIESNELAKAVTSDSYSNRWLGKNKTVTVPSSVLWLMTGNNISVCGDFNTRFLVVELDPRSANPDQRRFDREDVASWCEEHRGKILGACMKIIMDGQGYVNPDLKPTRFPSWDRFVRMPILKTCEIDVAEIFQKNKMSDPKIEGQNNFFEAWYNVFGSSPTTAKQVLNHCREVTEQERLSGRAEDNEMAGALKDVFSGSSLPGTRGLGKWLSSMKNRFFGDYKLVHAGKGTNRTQFNRQVWVVQLVDKRGNV